MPASMASHLVLVGNVTALVTDGVAGEIGSGGDMCMSVTTGARQALHEIPD
jgi:hypothetical protein